MYMQTPLALQRLLIQENMMAEQNPHMKTYLSTCSVTKRENTKSYRILEAIKSPICCNRWFFETRKAQETEQYCFKTKDKNLPKIFTLPISGSVAFSSSKSFTWFSSTTGTRPLVLSWGSVSTVTELNSNTQPENILQRPNRRKII